MISMITGFCIPVGVVIAVVLLEKLLSSGKGGRFIQAEMFTSIVTVVLVGIIAFAAALFWTGIHVFLSNLIADTVVTFAVFLGVGAFAAFLGKARTPSIVS